MNADLCFKFSKKDWEKLSADLDANDEIAWNKAIGVFRRRMNERFFSCIDALEQADTQPDKNPECTTPTIAKPIDHCIPGFAIIALCCLLIESLQNFREDQPVTAETVPPTKLSPNPCVEKGSGTNQQFKAFLGRPAFGDAFSGSVMRKFNDGIRNGILHNAETRGWVIWRDYPPGKIVEPEQNGHALNRTEFYAALKKEFDSYLLELSDCKKEALRKKFRERMARLCEKT